MYETKKVDEPEDTKEGIVEQEDAKEGIVGARVEGTSPSSVGRRAPSRVEMKSTWGEARRRSTGVSGTISCEAWINVVGKEVRTMVGRKNCRGGGGGEAARERERASKRLAGTRAEWRSRSPEAVAASAEKGPREAEVGRPLGRGAGLIAPGGNQGWMDEPVVGGGDCQTPRKGRGKRRRKRVPQREASPDAPDGDWVRKEERSLEVVTAKRRGRAAGSGGEHGCLRERRVPAHQMETGCEKKRRCGRRLRRKGRGDAPWPGEGMAS